MNRSAYQNENNNHRPQGTKKRENIEASESWKILRE